MRLLIKLILAGSVIGTLITGCTNIPKSSPMAKIKCGMSRGEVIDKLDAPGEISQTATWREYLIPWKTSSDYRTIYFYDGLGSIEFDRTGSKVVIKINYTGKLEV